MVLWKLKFTKSHDYLILKVISSLALMHKDLPWAHYYNFIFTIFLKNIQAVLPHDKIKVGDMSGASFTIKSKSEVLTSSQLSIIPSVIANLLVPEAHSKQNFARLWEFISRIFSLLETFIQP